FSPKGIHTQGFRSTIRRNHPTTDIRPLPRRTGRTAHDESPAMTRPVIASPQAACAAATMNENALDYVVVSVVLAASSPVFGVGAAPCSSAHERRVYVGSAHVACRRPDRATRQSLPMGG